MSVTFISCQTSPYNADYADHRQINLSVLISLQCAEFLNLEGKKRGATVKSRLYEYGEAYGE